MKVSIFTDASVVQNHCGYAFYIGCTAGKIQKAGKLKIRTTNVLIAEMHCIANALHTLKHSKFNPITKVWIYSDSLMSIYAINDAIRLKDNEHRAVVDEIRFLMMEICLRENRSIRDINKMFSLNHIKAHTGKSDKLSKINQWCDVNARYYARPIKPTKKKLKVA